MLNLIFVVGFVIFSVVFAQADNSISILDSLLEKDIPAVHEKHVYNEAGKQFLANLGQHFGVNLGRESFELDLARQLVNADTDRLELRITSLNTKSDCVFKDMDNILAKRYDQVINYGIKWNSKEKFITEANIWFYLAGKASELNSPAEVDVELTHVLQLADRIRDGQPFYTKPLVLDLIQSSLLKFPSDIASMLKTLGESILATVLVDANSSVPAEFFQFWQELCLFVEKRIALSNDQLSSYLTLINDGNVQVSLKNLDRENTPLTENQIDAIKGFLEAKLKYANIGCCGECSDEENEEDNEDVEDDTPSDFEDREKGGFITPSLEVLNAFFTGFSNIVEDAGTMVIHLGHRHQTSVLQLAEYSFLVQTLRRIQESIFPYVQESEVFVDFNGSMDTETIAEE